MLFFTVFLGCEEETTKDSGNISTAVEEPSSDEPAQEPSQEERVVPCDISIMRVNPEDQTVEHYFRDTLSATLTGVDTTAQIRVLDPTGIEILGTFSTEEIEMPIDSESSNPDDLDSLPRSVLSFDPSGLSSNTRYTMEVSYCQGSQNETFAFTTSEYGTPVTSSMIDKTFPMTLQNGNWVNPEGVGPILSALLQNSILFGILDERESELDVRLGVSVDNSFNQDYCFPTITDELPTFTYNNPSFEMGPANVGVVISGFFIAIGNFYISGALSEDGGSWGHGVMKGTFDARDLDLALPLSMGEICTLVESFGSVCGPCNDGISMCFDVEVKDLGGTLISDPLECVQYAQCHPQCNDNGCMDPDMGVCYESEQGH